MQHEKETNMEDTLPECVPLSGTEAEGYLWERKLFNPETQSPPAEILVLRIPTQIQEQFKAETKTMRLSKLIEILGANFSRAESLQKLLAQLIDPVGVLSRNADGTLDIVWVVEY